MKLTKVLSAENYGKILRVRNLGMITSRRIELLFDTRETRNRLLEKLLGVITRIMLMCRTNSLMLNHRASSFSIARSNFCMTCATAAGAVVEDTAITLILTQPS